MVELLPMDNRCPKCGVLVEQSDGSVEYSDGTAVICSDCGADLIAVSFTDGSMSLVEDDSEPDGEY